MGSSSSTPDPSALTVGVDLMPTGTALLNLADEAVKARMTFEQFMQTPAMVKAKTDQNLQDAQDAFNKAMANNNVKEIQAGMSGAQNE